MMVDNEGRGCGAGSADDDNDIVVGEVNADSDLRLAVVLIFCCIEYPVGISCKFIVGLF